MVKYYTYTDRTIRYTNRCNFKFKNETTSEIKKKNTEISSLRRSIVDLTNKLKRTIGSYNFVFTQYNDIYNSYIQALNSNQSLNAELETLKCSNQSLSITNEMLYNKNKELHELNIELEQKHSYTVDECGKLKEKYNELLDEYVETEIKNQKDSFEDKPI